VPHCIIDYSASLAGKVSPKAQLNAAYIGALNSQLFVADDIKSRLIPFQDFTSGASQQDFIHVVIKILSGRTNRQRKALSNSVLTEFTKLSLSSVSLTVEVVEIEKYSYNKVVN
jgi:5-carboxymethyl-2-hydroxymuconate isomerase